MANNKMAVTILSKALADRVVTEADRLYRAIGDGDAYEDVQDCLDDVKGFLDNLMDVLEASGAKVEGIEYLD